MKKKNTRNKNKKKNYNTLLAHGKKIRIKIASRVRDVQMYRYDFSFFFCETKKMWSRFFMSTYRYR